MITTKSLEAVAAKGDRDTLFRLAHRFRFSRNPKRRDAALALELWKSAADLGHVRARFYVGTCYDFGIGTRRSFSKAMHYYARAAHNGHAVAQYNLARGYLTGPVEPRALLSIG